MNSLKQTKNNAKIIDVNTLIAAGFNPKTGLPDRITEDKEDLKCDIKKCIRILDEQNAINRYIWYNLPSGLDGQLLERILYYKGQGMFFYMDTDETFYFLPYALDGTIDVYGRFKAVTPLPFNGKATDKKDAWITGLTKIPLYEIPNPEEIDEDIFKESCVLLSDYSKQISQTNISRQILNDPIIDAIAEAFPLARTSLIANCGVKGVRVNDQDQQANVTLANASVIKAALSGRPWIPIVGQLDFQELTNGTPLKSEEYLLYMQALDNFRLSLYGLDNGGLFQKKAHMLQSEQELNQGNVGLVYQDGLTIRQKFCDMVNAIWNLGIYCEASEIISGMDKDLDGEVSDNQDQSGVEGEQPVETEE